MASPASQGRRRSQAKPNTEDHALNMIASEAEARLAAKRAARAEARSIRMKELERMQQEADEKMDREYQRSLLTDDAVKQRSARVADKIQARIAAVTETEMNGPASHDMQIKAMQENLREMSERFKQAMVSNAQLDNEKQALAYQVDCLKDRLEDSEEVIENLRQEISDKTKEHNKLSRENKNNFDELNKMREQVLFRDRLLEEHGIPTDGSEQPADLSHSDLSTSRINESLNLDSVELDQSVLNKSRESSRRSSAPDDRESLLEQIKILKDKVSDLRRDPESEDIKMKDVENLQRELNKQANELKVRIQKLETENARLEGNSLRLETQVKRYKSQAEAAESVEDTLLADKRKLARELRNAQEHTIELETEKEHLQKRVEKYKQRRKEDF